MQATSPSTRGGQHGSATQPKSRPTTPFPTNVPRGAKNAQVHQPRLNQGPGAKVTSHDQSSHLNEASGARTAGYHHGNHSSQGSGSRTPGCAIDTRPSQIWGGATPHPRHQQKHNQSYGGRIGGQTPFSPRGARGGTHYRFGDEDDDGLFISPRG
jgi:hypothetical protein